MTPALKETEGKMEPVLNPDSKEAKLIISNETAVVCPHCQSGWVIIALGVSNHEITMMATCSIAAAKRAFFCPYCGKDMTEIYRWENRC